MSDFAALAYRALWELDNRSGFKALRTPAGAVVPPSAVVGWREWFDRLPEDHRLRALRIERSVPNEVPSPDWHLEPLASLRWPQDVHWTQAMRAGIGDLRLTWEANRFGEVWDWIGTCADAGETLSAWVSDWRRSNPFRAGVNWASGQELALRSIAWLAAAAAYGDDLSEGVWTGLVELLYWHGTHIESEAGFARNAVANNHAIAEALGLAAIGDAFQSDFVEAARWRAQGIAWLRREVEQQFFDDGGYCQHSHAYHHFALELLLEAFAWFPELRDALRPVLHRSQRLIRIVCECDGAAPNFGPNDRAVPTNFAVIHDRLRTLTGDDGELGTESGSFPDAGLHVLRRDDWTATLRCGPLARRAGHDDALHVEVWHRGVPCAIDAGSYLYTGADHAWYCGATSHNVCNVDGREPRRLIGRFTRADGVDPELVEVDLQRGHLVATYDAYAPVRWERRVRTTSDSVHVIDLMGAPTDEDRYTLAQHWLLNCAADRVSCAKHDLQWRIEVQGADFVLVLDANADIDVEIRAASASRAYGQRSPATSITAHCRASRVRLRAQFIAR